jgi:hypothetical protein
VSVVSASGARPAVGSGPSVDVILSRGKAGAWTVRRRAAQNVVERSTQAAGT